MREFRGFYGYSLLEVLLVITLLVIILLILIDEII